MEDFTFCTAICISNVMATTMGRLAMEIVESVSKFRDVDISKWFCGSCSYKSKRLMIYSIFSFFMVVALSLGSYLEISLATWGYNQDLNCETIENSRWFGYNPSVFWTGYLI